MWLSRVSYRALRLTFTDYYQQKTYSAGWGFSETHTLVYRLVPFHGLVALACGYVVAVKQFHPDSVAFPPPAPPTFRVKVRKGSSNCDCLKIYMYILS